MQSYVSEQGFHMVWMYGHTACFISCEQQNLGQTCQSVQCFGQGVGSTSSRIQNDRAIHVVVMTVCIMAEPAYPLPWWIMRLYLGSGRLLTIWQCLFIMMLQGGACTCQAISKVEPSNDHWDANTESAFWSLLCPVQRNQWKIPR